MSKVKAVLSSLLKSLAESMERFSRLTAEKLVFGEKFLCNNIKHMYTENDSVMEAQPWGSIIYQPESKDGLHPRFQKFTSFFADQGATCTLRLSLVAS